MAKSKKDSKKSKKEENNVQSQEKESADVIDEKAQEEQQAEDEPIVENADEQNEEKSAEEQKVTEEELTPEEILEKERDIYKDKYVRLAAEFDNYRRRTLKEKSDLIKNGGETIFINMLPVVDDFDRAMDAVTSTEDIHALKEGVDLIANKFKSFLKQNGIQEIAAKEEEFDTDKHEAITKIPAPSEDLKGKVVDVIEKGYMMHDKVIRFAKVVVGE
ncbi:MAG: nucleotide exchange factor GrpE [Bacteroidales bacterium]